MMKIPSASTNGTRAQVPGPLQPRLLDAMAQPVIGTDPNGAITYWNAAAEKLCGWSSVEVQGRDIVELLATDADRVQALQILDVVQSGKCWAGEFFLQRRDGTLVATLISASAMHGEAGEPEGMVVTVTDITERQRTKEDAIQSKSRYERLVNHIDGIVWEGTADLASGEFTFTLVSERLRKILGYDPKSWLDDASQWLDAIYEEDRAWAPEACMAASRERHDHAVEYRMVAEDGRIVWLRDLVRILHSHGDVVTSAGVMFDITERKEAERALFEAKEKAEELARLKSNFLANMSHEIRTPLTSIIGFAEILESEPTAEVTSKAQLIRGSGHRLMMTLDSVMDFAQLESGSLRLDVARIDVVAHTKDLRPMFELQASQKGLDIRFECEHPSISAYADPAALFRVLTNLISNAIKFTTEGGVHVKIGQDDAFAFFEIGDTGIGIGEEFLGRLFEDFKQESEGFARNYEGVGLGLSITKRLVDLMGGSIEVKSRKGEGSTFTVRLPLSASTTPTPDASRPVAPAPRARSASILVVEDQDDAQHLLKHLLRPNYHVDIATSAEAALAAAERSRYDLILMDINLGGTSRNGTEVLKVLRRWPAYVDVPIIACTAYAMPGDDERFLAEGFDGYLGKPFRKVDLFNAVKALLPDTP